MNRWLIEQEKEVADLVKQILATKRRDAGADTTGCERKIDRLVYELYGLTPAEFKLVEESAT